MALHFTQRGLIQLIILDKDITQKADSGVKALSAADIGQNTAKQDNKKRKPALEFHANCNGWNILLTGVMAFGKNEENNH